jgi:protein-S-isoprenylcysteine O-methyltransferase Ste14
MGSMITSIHKATHYVSHDLFGGPRILGFNWVINFQKGMTVFWVLGLMLYYQNFSVQAWVYLALHGSYGIIWILKDNIFPDSRWQTKITLGGGLTAIVTVLGPYWVAPYLLISPELGEAHQGASMLWTALAIAIYALGLTLMLVSDAQKFYILKYQKGLITTGLFHFIRHPNYLGEMMIYGSFALLVWHWIPWAILAWVWGGYFSINIIMKERSMSRYAEWSEYKKRSWYLIPFIF